MGCSRRGGLGSNSWGRGDRRLVGTELRLKEVWRPGDRAEGASGVVREQWSGWSELERHLEVKVVRTG